MRSFIQRRVMSEDLAYAIKDAEEALQAAFQMRDWTGVKKYADQLAKMDRQKFDKEGEANRVSMGMGPYGVIMHPKKK